MKIGELIARLLKQIKPGNYLNSSKTQRGKGFYLSKMRTIFKGKFFNSYDIEEEKKVKLFPRF